MSSLRNVLPAGRLPRLAALLAWCALIFALSAQPHLRISDHDLRDLVLRKLAHLGAYAVLALLASMTFTQEPTVSRRARLAALAFAIAYACTDEYHQSFVPGRTAALHDVGIDTIGASIGLFTQARWHHSTLEQP
jgi:VanZ family protein